MEGREVVGVGVWLQDNTRLVSGFGLGGGASWGITRLNFQVSWDLCLWRRLLSGLVNPVLVGG